MTSKQINESIDMAFVGTKESQGYVNAKKAIKYVLYDDSNSITNLCENKNKWLFISNKLNGRDLAKELHYIDLIQLLVNFCYCYTLSNRKVIKMTEDKYKYLKSSIFLSLESTIEEIIEFVVYSSMISVEEVYILLSSNKDMRISLIDFLISYRYKEDNAKKLDKILSIKTIKKECESILNKFKTLDLEFALIKRKYPDYKI